MSFFYITMAENKKSFIAYCDWQETFKELSDENAGKLVKHLFDYVNDENPKAKDELIKMCFIPIKQNLKRDLKKYEVYKEKQRLNGLKGGRPKKTQITQRLNKKPKKADSVNVNVNDNVYKYLKENIKEKIELFEMQNKKSFTDYDNFIENFNNKVIEEKLDFDVNILFARLKRLNANWDKTPKKEKVMSLAQKMKKDYGIS